MPPVRVATYNILAQKLASPSYFTACVPEYTRPAYRLPRILKQLEREVAQNAVICLQEVCLDWSGELHSFFQRKNYHLVISNYGVRVNGYMGVAMAVPNKRFAAENVDILSVSEAEKLYKYQNQNFTIDSNTNDSKGSTSSRSNGRKEDPNNMMLSGDEQPKKNSWKVAASKANRMIAVQLRDKDSPGKKFCVATYHMPCAFIMPQVMVIHTSAALKAAQNFARSRPLIFAGDFNFTPSSTCYRLVTSGTLPKDHADYPDETLPPWPLDLQYKMSSAYAQANGNEPDFTNYAIVGQNPAFIETLDYIFMSEDCTASNALRLPSRDYTNGPLPSRDEPSDHLMIAADIDF